ncbi:MAG: serine/threonine-protein kinase [Planctomycetota bacterium]
MRASERYERVFELFEAVCDLPVPARQERLRELCADDQELQQDVESMLAADGREHSLIDAGESGRGVAVLAAGLLGSGADGEASTIAFDAAQRRGAEEPLPTEIGGYQVLRRIGEGGMGIIYEAQQESPHRRVALKVLRPGALTPSLLKRFRREAHVLGQLQHPGIAQIHEAGVADAAGTRPFLVMELVEGRPLLEHAEFYQLEARHRVELVARVCDAVQHAHQKGVIHRDLKPGNVLVVPGGPSGSADTTTFAHATEITGGTGTLDTLDAVGQPKVLDFGIARVTDPTTAAPVTQQTEVGQIIGTLAYMSPEQVTGDTAMVDTRCDVYALGVLLYEVLSGHKPHDVAGKSIPEAARVIQEHEPTRLGAHDRSLRGDLETIVDAAMAKDRNRRYGSAAELAADLRRYLTDLPIDARPPSAAYQLAKFASRNRGLVVGLAATLLALVLGLCGTGYYLLEAIRQADAAESARVEADKVADFQLHQIDGIDVAAMGAELRRSLLEAVPTERREDLESRLRDVNFTDLALQSLETNLFERSLTVIDTDYAEQPLVQAKLLLATARTMQGQGLHEPALDPMRQALAIRRRELGLDHRDTLAAAIDLSKLLGLVSQFEEAEARLREVMETRRRERGPTDPLARQALGGLVDVLFLDGRGEEALVLARAAVGIERGLLEPEHPDLLASIGRLRTVLIQLGHLEEAEPLAQELLDVSTRLLGARSPKTLSALSDLAALRRAQGRLDEAAEIYERTLADVRQLHGNSHPDTLLAINNLAATRFQQGEYEPAERLLREAVATQGSVYGYLQKPAVLLLENLASLFDVTARGADAEPLWLEALATRRRLDGDQHPDTLLALLHLGSVLNQRGEPARAMPLIIEAVDGAREVFGDHDERTLVAAGDLAQLLEQQAAWGEAEPYRRLVVAGLRADAPLQRRTLARWLEKLAENLTQQGRRAEAEPLRLEVGELREAAAEEEGGRGERVREEGASEAPK